MKYNFNSQNPIGLYGDKEFEIALTNRNLSFQTLGSHKPIGFDREISVRTDTITKPMELYRKIR